MQKAYQELFEEKKLLEADFNQLQPILISRDKQIEDLNSHMRQLKEQSEKEKLQQREEYLRAFNKLKDEINASRADMKNKEDALAFLKS